MHYRTLCSQCGTTISQCRCRSEDKITNFEVCSSCRAKAAAQKIGEESAHYIWYGPNAEKRPAIVIVDDVLISNVREAVTGKAGRVLTNQGTYYGFVRVMFDEAKTIQEAVDDFNIAMGSSLTVSDVLEIQARLTRPDIKALYQKITEAFCLPSSIVYGHSAVSTCKVYDVDLGEVALGDILLTE